MEYLILIGIGLTLVILGVQDFRERKISVIFLLITLVLCSTYYITLNTFSDLPKRVLINTGFSSLILVSGTLLVRLRRPKEAMSTFIGTGDFLFLLVISPMFSFESYLVFLNTSIILILILYSIQLYRKKLTTKSPIPFAGALAFCCLCVLAINEFTKIDLTSISFTNLPF